MEFKQIYKKITQKFKSKNKTRVLQEKLNELEYLIKYKNISTRLDAHKNIYQKYLSEEPIFTFCMPTYNGEKYIARALESILMQETSYKYKIWIIDDCSTDHTVDIIKEYAKLYPDVFDIEVNEKNERGLTMCCKICNRVKTKYWMNFDQDDYWLTTDKLQRTIEFLDIHPEVSMYASNLFIKKGSELTAANRIKRKNFYFNFTDVPLLIKTLLQTTSVVYRNLFTENDLQRINSFAEKGMYHCVAGDTFRNMFALSKGLGYYDTSIDSVYNWTETGAWSKYNIGQQAFYDTQYFYDSISFFEEKKHKDHLKNIAKLCLQNTIRYCSMLETQELEELKKIEKDLSND